MHGPCDRDKPGAPCMKERKCMKRFPKAFCETTTIVPDGYSNYRRRDRQLSNRWVVPYNPY
ncbi:uncharacterized protein CPUR_08211 [Claviceps purpurea 20.1]|uniref:Uncharacterized protein n=1 Tax=Claviceps purpurea (strain 20.1) TaxID=1111077 RepID=M1WID3_CLAP2|nr:uncharacterized protein CPUR_08211 [Claviceps purpurea 20.1]